MSWPSIENVPNRIPSPLIPSCPIGRNLFDGLQAAEVRSRDDIVGVEAKRGFKIRLGLRRDANLAEPN